MIREAAKVVLLQGRTFLTRSSSRLVNAMVPRHLGEPWTQWHGLILLVQHSVEFQEDLGCGVLGIFRLSEILPADPQHVPIVSLVTCAQKFGADCSRLVLGAANLRVANG